MKQLAFAAAVIAAARFYNLLSNEQINSLKYNDWMRNGNRPFQHFYHSIFWINRAHTRWTDESVSFVFNASVQQIYCHKCSANTETSDKNKKKRQKIKKSVEKRKKASKNKKKTKIKKVTKIAKSKTAMSLIHKMALIVFVFRFWAIKVRTNGLDLHWHQCKTPVNIYSNWKCSVNMRTKNKLPKMMHEKLQWPKWRENNKFFFCVANDSLNEKQLASYYSSLRTRKESLIFFLEYGIVNTCAQFESWTLPYQLERKKNEGKKGNDDDERIEARIGIMTTFTKKNRKMSLFDHFGVWLLITKSKQSKNK